jgi:hypothetical protein
MTLNILLISQIWFCVILSFWAWITCNWTSSSLIGLLHLSFTWSCAINNNKWKHIQWKQHGGLLYNAILYKSFSLFQKHFQLITSHIDTFCLQWGKEVFYFDNLLWYCQTNHDVELYDTTLTIVKFEGHVLN